MDLQSAKGNDPLNFMCCNNMKNYVEDFTRIVSRYSSKKNEFNTIKSLIDVILHNSNLIHQLF